MSDALLGVLIGGLIGISGTIATIVFQYKQWKINRRLEYLQKKKEKHRQDFEIFSQKLIDPKNDENYLDRIVDLSLKVPKDLLDAMENTLDNIDNIEERRNNRVSIMIEEMGKYLKKIDNEIDDLTK